MSRSTEPDEGMFLAWGDESHEDSPTVPGTYILAAAILDPADVDEVRDEASQILLPGQKKAHWRSDSVDRHDQVIKTIARLPIEALVVVRQGPSTEAHERRRRKCFERLALELESLGCGNLTLESRGAKDDKSDRTMLDALRAQKVTQFLRLDHKPGPADPLLWVADALCGAMLAGRRGEPRWLDELGNHIDVIELDDRG